VLSNIAHILFEQWWGSPNVLGPGKTFVFTQFFNWPDNEGMMHDENDEKLETAQK